MDSISVARALLKVAAAEGAGRHLGRALYAAGRGVKGAVAGAGRFGSDVAKGLELGEGGQGLARRGTQAAVIGAGGLAALKGKRKVDQKIEEFKYRHGFYPQGY